MGVEGPHAAHGVLQRQDLELELDLERTVDDRPDVGLGGLLEILQDIGVLDFGKGVTAKANVALWRERGEHRPLVAEFAFQVKFKRRDELHAKAVGRAEQFFVSLQLAATDWVLLGVTKTGVVYGLHGSPPSKE